MRESPPHVSFGIARLLLAVAMFSFALVFTKSIGVAGAVVPLAIAIPIEILALLVRKRHARSLVRSVVCTFVGILVGFLLSTAISPPYEPGDEFRYMISGAVVGWLVGAMLCSV